MSDFLEVAGLFCDISKRLLIEKEPLYIVLKQVELTSKYPTTQEMLKKAFSLVYDGYSFSIIEYHLEKCLISSMKKSGSCEEEVLEILFTSKLFAFFHKGSFSEMFDFISVICDIDDSIFELSELKKVAMG